MNTVNKREIAKIVNIRLGSIRSSLRDGLSTSYRLTKGCWGLVDFGFRGLVDNNFLAEDGGLLQVLPHTVHLNFFD